MRAISKTAPATSHFVPAIELAASRFVMCGAGVRDLKPARSELTAKIHIDDEGVTLTLARFSPDVFPDADWKLENAFLCIEEFDGLLQLLADARRKSLQMRELLGRELAETELT